MPPFHKAKPRPIILAEWSLWAWTIWVCLYGLYEAWSNMPELMRQVTESAGGMIAVDPGYALKWVVLYYIFQAAVTVWFILKIGEGKHWARSSFMWCFVLELAWLIVSRFISPSFSFSDIPDLGLQIFAIYMLYREPGARWFKGDAAAS